MVLILMGVLHVIHHNNAGTGWSLAANTNGKRLKSMPF
jgi:hypothetical protein